MDGKSIWKSIYQSISINGFCLPGDTMGYPSHGTPKKTRKLRRPRWNVAARWPRHCASCCLCCSPPVLWRLLSSRALGRRPGGPIGVVEVKNWGNPWEIQEKYMGKLMGKIRIMIRINTNHVQYLDLLRIGLAITFVICLGINFDKKINVL